MAIAPAFAGLQGCDAASAESYVNAVLEAAEKILGLSSAGDGWYADLGKAIAALEAAEASWKGGSAASIVVSALDTVEAVLAVIPVTATYSALIDLLVSAIEACLTAFATKSAGRSVHVNALVAANPHRGRIPLRRPRFYQTQRGAFRAQWNELVAANPNLSQAKL